jgi:hypothetical protein
MRWSAALLCLVVIGGCADAGRGAADVRSYRAERNREAEVLIARVTPNDLAAAALLLGPDDPDKRQPLDLIVRAQTLAPTRPELVWIHLTICERLRCKARAQIAARLQALDPDNGFAWALDLDGLPPSDSDAITAVIARMGASRKMTTYWNQLQVMMVDALAVAQPSESLATRGFGAIGIVAAESMPPLQAVVRACGPKELDLAGRRDACEAVVARMEQSDTMLTQSLALSMQVRWWPPDSTQRDVLRAKRRQLDYLLTMSSRIRWWRLNHDMAVRIEAARSTAREEDVARAVVKSFGLPLQAPEDWRDPRYPG